MFPYQAYTGKWLHVNLTTGKVEAREYDPTLAEGYLGGNGFGTRLLWEHVGPEVDPLAPESLLIFATGPLCGTLVPNGARLEVIAKSPLTGIYGDANAGGFFGPELKFAGWDAIVVTGQAPHPVHLAIADDRAELRDAGDLWGRTTSQTEAAIRRTWGDPQVKTATIGPAGENLVRFAGIQITPQRSAARCGLGAVMGSKRLKAIAVRGHGSIHVADPARFHDLAVDFHRRLRANPLFPAVSAHGTPGIVTLMDALGRFPTRNFQMGSFPEVDRIGAEALEARAFVRHLACFGCPVGCDKLRRIPDGSHAGTALRSVEYETLNALGACVWNADLDAIGHTIGYSNPISFSYAFTYCRDRYPIAYLDAYTDAHAYLRRNRNRHHVRRHLRRTGRRLATAGRSQRRRGSHGGGTLCHRRVVLRPR